MAERITIRPTIKPSEKQYLAYKILWDKATSFLLYGGSAGGGKSWLGCEWLLTNCYNYPGTRWFIGRRERTRLMSTSYITWQKVCKWHGIPDTDWKLNGQYNYIEFIAGHAKGSRIDLIDLAFKPADPEYSRLGSLEFTGGWIEEADEVELMCFDILKARVGRQLNKEYGLFPAKLLLTCNPTDGWLYRIFYKPHKEGNLAHDYAFIKALYSDNPHTKEYYGQQLSLISDDRTRARLMEGNWEYSSSDMAIMKLDAIIDLFTNPIASADMNRRLTGDIARFGSDRTVLGTWRGWDLYQVVEFSKQGLNKTREDIRSISIREQIPYASIVLDEEGLGGGLVDEMQGVLGFKGNRSAILKPDDEVEETTKLYKNMPKSYLNKNNYRNLRTQCYFLLGEMVNNHKMSISAESLTEMQKQAIIEELQQIKRVETSPDAPLQITPKEEVQEALGRSPDYADMIMMRVLFDILKVAPPRGVYHEPDPQFLAEHGITNKFGGIVGYGVEGFDL